MAIFMMAFFYCSADAQTAQGGSFLPGMQTVSPQANTQGREIAPLQPQVAQPSPVVQSREG